MPPIDFSTMSRRDFLRMIGMTTATGVAATTLSACGRLFPFGGASDDDGEGEEHEEMQSLVVCKGSGLGVFALDPIQVDTTELLEILEHALSGLARWRIVDGVMTAIPDLAEELSEPKENENGTVTYTYTIVEGAKWSDGRAITADDFVYSWNRAANIANSSSNREFFSCIEGYSDLPDMQLAVVADDPRTLSVTLSYDVPYWNDLIAYVAFKPIRQDIVGDDYVWMTDVKRFLYSGPYAITEFSRAFTNSSSEVIAFKKRDDYVYADSITVRNLRLVFGKTPEEQIQLIQGADSGDMLVSDKDSIEAVHILDSQSPALIRMSKDVPGIKRRAVPLLGTYWLIWNMNKQLVPEELGLVGDAYERAQSEIRHAFALLMNRDSSASANFGYKPASTLVPPGMSDTGGSDFATNAGSSPEYDGYIDTTTGATERNRNQAIEILKKYYHYDETNQQFSGVPAITFLSGDYGYGDASTDLINTCYNLGIVIESERVEFSTLSDRCKNGMYDLTFGNWFADFTDPITFLSQWVTSSVINFPQFGRGKHENARIYSLDLSPIGEETTISSATWAESYDALINRISREKDRTKRFVLLHQAEDLVMGTWAIMPSVYPASSYIIREGLTGMEMMPFHWSFYGNVHAED